MLITITETLGKSWQIYLNNFRKLLPYLGLLFLPTLAVSFVGVLGLWLRYFLPSSTIAVNIIVFAVYVAGLVFSIWGGMALMKAIKSLTDNQPPSNWKENFAGTSQLIWPMIYTTLLIFLIVFAGSLLLIIPGLIFGVWYAFANYIIVAEGKLGMGALMASKELVINRWWKIFWRLIAPFVVYSIIFYVIGTLSTNLINFLVKQILWNSVVNLLFINLLNILFLPLLIGALAVLYTSAKDNPVELPPLPR